MHNTVIAGNFLMILVVALVLRCIKQKLWLFEHDLELTLGGAQHCGIRRMIFCRPGLYCWHTKLSDERTRAAEGWQGRLCTDWSTNWSSFLTSLQPKRTFSFAHFEVFEFLFSARTTYFGLFWPFRMYLALLDSSRSFETAAARSCRRFAWNLQIPNPSRAMTRKSALEGTLEIGSHERMEHL